MKTFRFVDFQVYKDAKEFYKLIIKEGDCKRSDTNLEWCHGYKSV